MKHIELFGYYGQKNMGDDAFGLIAIWGIKKYWGATVTLLSSRGPESNREKIYFSFPKQQRFRGEFLFYVLARSLKSYRVVLAGGSILHSRQKILSINGIIFLLSKLGLCKIGAIGVSLGPFKTPKDYEYVAKQLKRFKFLVLRDKNSYNIALSMKLPYKPVLAADLAFLLPEIYQKKKDHCYNKTNIIGVSLCHYERYVQGDIENEKRRETLCFEVLRDLVDVQELKFCFFVLNGNDFIGDREIIESTIKTLNLKRERYEVVDYSPNTLEMLSKIEECSVVFTTRLHGAIFSAATNIPSLLVEYHVKCSDYLDDIAIDDSWRIGDMSMPPQQIKEKIIQLLDYEGVFYKNKDVIMKRAKENFLAVTI